MMHTRDRKVMGYSSALLVLLLLRPKLLSDEWSTLAFTDMSDVTMSNLVAEGRRGVDF